MLRVLGIRFVLDCRRRVAPGADRPLFVEQTVIV